MTEEPQKGMEKQKRRGAILVYETLREDILWLRIKPGTAIDEVALADRFAVSRTPIREALLLLQGDWLVEFLPNRTTIVAPFTLNNSGDYYDAHLVLARTAARAAALSGNAERARLLAHQSKFVAAVEAGDYNQALRVTLDLMGEIVALSGNIFLKRYFGHSLDSGIRTKILYYFPNVSGDELATASQLQRAVIDTICAGDADASDAAMRALILQEVEISLRALHPSIGEAIDVEQVGAIA